MKGKAAFSLECSDIAESWHGHYGHLKGSTITLLHRPTGIEVVGSVPQVHNTNGKLRAAEDQLRQQLVAELTQRVARQLRIPGRQV